MLTLALCACQATPEWPEVHHWGAMREVLRDGHSEGRVALAAVLGPHTVALGAAEGLAAEITVVDGRARLSEVHDAAATWGVSERAPRDGERATLLILADVEAWSELELPPVGDLAALEDEVRARAAAGGLDASAPFPFRVAGRATALRLHVLDHSCPTAARDGPPPWRFDGENERVVLVGFHAEDAAGVLTHHGQRSHVHAVLTEHGVSGHVDAVAFDRGATLYLPER